jgi:ketosteroid isomerase-like protein
VSEGNVEIIRELYDNLARGVYSNRSLFDEKNLVFRRHGKALGLVEGEWRGSREIRAAVLEYLRSWEDLRNEPEQITKVGDEMVLVLERQIGRGRASGLVMEREMASLFTLRNGKIIRWDAFWDLLADDLLDQVGREVEPETTLSGLEASWVRAPRSEPRPELIFSGRGSNEDKMAERVGFEPTRQLSPPTRFPVAHLKPLGHLSRSASKGSGANVAICATKAPIERGR